MIDYKEIVDNLKVESVKSLLEQLGAEVIEKEDCLICSTICHNVEASRASKKLYYYKNSHMFYCYTECGAQTIFKFLEHYYETRGIAYDWYRDILQVVLNCSASIPFNAGNTYKSQRDKYENGWAARNLQTYPSGVLNVFVKRYPVEWLKDRISTAAMDKYNILYSISQNKIIIPHYDINGDLVGIRGRALNAEDIEQFGKYMPIQIENKWYSHPLSLNLYGLNFNKDNIKKYKVCYIFESEKSVMQAESFSLPNCGVAACGSNLNKFQVNLLLKYCKPNEIVVCFDREEKENEHTYYDKLYNICKKYSRYCNMSFVYDKNGITKMKDSPTDNGEEIFQTLLKERVKVK